MPRKTRVLDHLTPAESLQVLHRLLRTHPELDEEAESIARFLVAEVSAETVASEVEELVWLPRAGRAPDPVSSQRVRDSLEETLTPLRERSKRLLDMGLKEEAAAILRGILLGLHTLSQRRGIGAEPRAALLEAAGEECRLWLEKARTRQRAAAPPLNDLLSGPLADWARPLYTVLATTDR